MSTWQRDGRTVYALEDAPDHYGRYRPRNRWSASVQPGPDTPLEECERIAQMIAAAPELLEALRQAVRLLAHDPFYALEADAARAAIAKATGVGESA